MERHRTEGQSDTGKEGKETETERAWEKKPLAATKPPHPTRLCPQGLSASLAAELLLRDGPNALRPPRGTPEYVKFARQLAGGLQCLMWVAAAICLIAFAIQASEGDLTTDDNVSGGSWGQTQDTRTWGTEDIEHGTQDMRDIGWG